MDLAEGENGMPLAGHDGDDYEMNMGWWDLIYVRYYWVL